MGKHRNYQSIIPTAWTMAHRRSFTDIPYSNEIFKRIEQIRKQNNVEIAEEFISPQVAPQIEARYKLINKLINKQNINQILEIACGFSPRGLQMTEDANVTYVDVDLKPILETKKAITCDIIQRTNYFFEIGNALNLKSLISATKHFNTKKPLIVVHEGLLRYLNFSGKALVAGNIRKLLTIFNGTWITPDITLKKVITTENISTNNKTEKVASTIKVDYDLNSFNSVTHAQQFFEGLGFFVKRYKFMEMKDDLVSPQKLHQDKKALKSLLKDPVVFEMTVR